MNTDLLIDVATAILFVPETFYMGSWFESNMEAPCGTVGCLAGHIVTASSRSKSLREAWHRFPLRHSSDWDSTPARACRALRITVEMGDRLFYLCNWPSKYALALDDVNSTPQGRARTTYKRVLRFIKTEGME